MNFKKSTLLIAGLLVSVAAFSAPNPAAFQAHKDAEIANTQTRIQINQQLLTCLQAAQDPAGLKACHETAKQAHQALDAQIKAQHAAGGAAPAVPAAQ